MLRNKRVLSVRYAIWALLLFCSIGLFLSSVYRAATYPLTHDECNSYYILNWAPAFGKWGANNHVLNTLLMQRCSSLFGDSALSLRLPNILAHVVYLAGTLLLLKRFRHTILLVSGFVMLNLNPFMLDFFFVARGYGLALAFTMLSIYLLAHASEAKQLKGRVFYLFLSCLTGSLAVLSNFSFLYFYLPLLLASAWLLLSDISLRRFSRSNIPAALALFIVNGLFLAFILRDIFRLQQFGEFTLGGNTGFITDTIGSLVRSSLYSLTVSQTMENVVITLMVGFFGLLLLFGLYILILTKETPLFVIFAVMTASAVALPILNHGLFHTLFPIERAALFYLPLAAVVILSALEWLQCRFQGRSAKFVVLVLPVAITVLLGWHFSRTFTLRSCYTWPFERHNIEIVDLIDQDRKKNFPSQDIMLGTDWKMWPSLSYYRFARKYSWLAPVRIRQGSGLCYHYVYTFESDVKEFREEQPSRLASYADTQTVLLRLDYARNHDHACIEKQESNEAMLPIDKAIALNKSDYRAYYDRGLALDKVGQYGRAFEEYTRTVELNPIFYPAYNYRAAILYKDSRFDLALEDLNHAIALNPRYATAYHNRGFLYNMMGMFDDALEDLNRAIQFDRNNGEVDEAYVERGGIYLRRGNKELAVSDFSKACMLGNKDGCDALRTARSR